MNNNLNNTGDKMPVLFVGHGSPMNAVEDNEYTREWERVAKLIPTPTAILAISAHWCTDGTRIIDEEYPKMIYDMYGFPEELYKIEYKSKGSPEFAKLTKELVQKEIKSDYNWGYDHGTWSVLHRMYPKADIPVYQLSIDRNAEAQTHYQLGKELQKLREQGVLIFGSGNVVHNLRLVDWSVEKGFAWAEEFDVYIKDNVQKRNFDDVIQYKKAGQAAQKSFTTPEHFYPLLYVLGASKDSDKLMVFNDSCTLGSLSMTSYMFF